MLNMTICVRIKLQLESSTVVLSVPTKLQSINFSRQNSYSPNSHREYGNACAIFSCPLINHLKSDHKETESQGKLDLASTLHSLPDGSHHICMAATVFRCHIS